ncbi:hypothetical protein [Aeromicrobium sp. Root472D3]|uniref:hypothetical protein n=1 Tax=Aeromicrobium sp. Root472D3 TaxID=1736540 RepID=UPI0006FE9517|nr:hypothetical protein [Aeromicrobium sp. Root472D3]KQX76114.1 hypothetical protein ASD10_13580 [Aeromicrobium sp. Root472D3]
MPDLSATPTTSDTRSTVPVRRLAIVLLGTLLTGLVGGLVWLWLAQPAEWEGRDGGLVLTEAAARGQFSVVVVFVLVGVIASVVSGWVTARLLPDLGWLAVPLVAVLSAVAAVVAWRVGVELGPPDPSTVAGVADGDRVPARLAVDNVAPFLVWPIFGLVGVIGATWSDGRRDARPGGRGAGAEVSERFEPRQHG